MSILMFFYIIFGVFLAVVAIPLILGKIPPNGLYGFRVKKTMENPELWYPVNRRTGKWLLVVSAFIIVAAAGLSLVPDISLDAYSLSVLGVFMLVFSAAIIATVRYMNSL
jgi:hypothetical protein